MDHRPPRVDVPTLLLVWPDDSPEHPRYCMIPVANMKPDPLMWLHIFCGEATPTPGHGGTPPDACRVVLPAHKVGNQPEAAPLPILEPVPDPG